MISVHVLLIWKRCHRLGFFDAAHPKMMMDEHEPLLTFFRFRFLFFKKEDMVMLVIPFV
jgi:hypothetical protein